MSGRRDQRVNVFGRLASHFTPPLLLLAHLHLHTMSLPPTRVPDDADDAAETDGTDDAPVDLVFAGVTSDSTPGTRTVRVRALDISRSFSDVRSVSVGGIHFVRAFVPDSGQDGPYCDYVDVRDCVQGHYSLPTAPTGR